MSDSSVTAWTGTRQAPLSMGLPRQEYWSGLPVFPPPGDLPDPGIELASLMSLALVLLYQFCHLGSLYHLQLHLISFAQF